MTVTEVELKIEEKQLDIEQMRLIGFPEEVIREQEKQISIYRKMLEAIQLGMVQSLDTSNPNKLLIEVASSFGISTERMFQKTRKREVVNARQVYVWLLRTTNVAKQTIIPYQQTKFVSLGAEMNKRDQPTFLGRHCGLDHATILHCLKVTNNLIETDKGYRELVNNLQRRLLIGQIPMPDIMIKAYKNEIHTKGDF